MSPASEAPFQETRRERKERYRRKRGRSRCIKQSQALADFGPTYVGHAKAGGANYMLLRLHGEKAPVILIVRETHRPGVERSETLVTFEDHGRGKALLKLCGYLREHRISYNKIVFADVS